jgi:hypothetical protein
MSLLQLKFDKCNVRDVPVGFLKQPNLKTTRMGAVVAVVFDSQVCAKLALENVKRIF